MKEQNAESKDKKTINELSEENEKLRLEVDALKHELEKIKGKKVFHASSDLPHTSFDRQALNVRLFSRKSYTSYLAGLIANTSIFQLYRKIIVYARKYALITTTLKILSFIFSFLQTGAIFVIAASLFVVSLPFTFIGGYAALIFTFFGNKKLKKKTAQMLEGKKIAVFFTQKGRSLDDSSFFAGMVRELCDRTDGVAIIVSPYFFSPRGITDNRRFYLSLRNETDNIIIVRRHFFFTVRRKMLKERGEDITIIY